MAAQFPRVYRNHVQLGIATGDMVAIVILISIGLLSHETNPVTSAAQTLLTVVPYFLGWSGAALLTRIYRQTTLESYVRTITRTAATWIIAALIGSAIRATELFPGSAPPVFVLVMLGMGLFILVSWRILLTYFVNRFAT